MTSLDASILDAIRTYAATSVPVVCINCSGTGSVRQMSRRFAADIFMVRSVLVTCEGCGGWGITWFEP